MKQAHNVAILGFGVVGGGVAKLINDNQKELTSYLGREIRVTHILDLRDFPDSPYAPLITHDFGDILADEDVDTVIEAMGGSHPAYEYTLAALAAGKNVITSNKEVVANFGDELVRLAAESGVSYRFEAAVGGGIPVITPLIGCLRQNKMREIRGILNGTTNYILTKMFTYGESFESALADAQAKGYAEANPNADISGTDAARKIAILTALAADALPPVGEIHTEGINGIRSEDVRHADAIGHRIKLLGRCIIGEEGELTVCVAPFLIPRSSALASVDGVYNAVEVVAEPLGNIMLYGQGAGAGATASAIVGDLIPIIAHGGADAIVPGFNRVEYDFNAAFEGLCTRSYVAIRGVSAEEARQALGEITVLGEDNELALITEKLTECEIDKRLAALGKEPISRIRFL